MEEILSKEKFVDMVIRDLAKKKALKEKGIKDANQVARNRVEKCLRKKRHAKRH